jgi:hypothetical protein
MLSGCWSDGKSVSEIELVILGGSPPGTNANSALDESKVGSQAEKSAAETLQAGNTS